MTPNDYGRPRGSVLAGSSFGLLKRSAVHSSPTSGPACALVRCRLALKGARNSVRQDRLAECRRPKESGAERPRGHFWRLVPRSLDLGRARLDFDAGGTTAP